MDPFLRAGCAGGPRAAQGFARGPHGRLSAPLRLQDRPGVLRRPHELPRARHPDQPGGRRAAETRRQGRRQGGAGHAELPAAHCGLPCRAAPGRRRGRAQSPLHRPGTAPPVRGPRRRRRDRLGQGSGAGPPTAGRRRAPQHCLGGADPRDAAAAAPGAAASGARGPQGPGRPLRGRRPHGRAGRLPPCGRCCRGGSSWTPANSRRGIRAPQRRTLPSSSTPPAPRASRRPRCSAMPICRPTPRRAGPGCRGSRTAGKPCTRCCRCSTRTA